MLVVELKFITNVLTFRALNLWAFYAFYVLYVIQYIIQTFVRHYYYGVKNLTVGFIRKSDKSRIFTAAAITRDIKLQQRQ